jgi:transcriptional regulator NrdR family protein
MKCPRCRTHELVVIDMVIGGEPVRLRSCSTCDARWWETEDGALPLSSVLALAQAS